jgi:hypothetical protein
MSKPGIKVGWQSVKAAARRLNRSSGHIARLCIQRLRTEGKARWITGGGKKGRWEIRTDATLKFRHSANDPVPMQLPTVVPGNPPVQITIGNVTIIIQPGNAPAVPASGDGRREAVKRSSKAVRRTRK